MVRHYRWLAGLLLVATLVLGGIAWGAAEAAPAAPKAKNVIIMISDGCGFNHMWAADLYQYGKQGAQPYESFPYRYAVSTHSASSPAYDPARAWADFNWVKGGATDSAAAGTALATGVKTKNGSIGVDPEGKPVTNLMEMAEGMGKSTGIVTSVSLTDATPAAFAAHVTARGQQEEIARQMVFSSGLEVAMGAGHPWWQDSGEKRAKPDYECIGESTWAALSAGTAGGDCDGDGQPDPWRLIEDRAAFTALATGPTPKRVFGMAQAWDALGAARPGDFTAAPYAVPFPERVPTLRELTEGALNVLDNNPRGFVLMVEGGAIDGAAHLNVASRMVEEEMEFNKAVEAVMAWVARNSNWQETLLIVTADHETGYVTGPGSDPKWQPLANNGAGKMPGLEFHSRSHTNSLVPLFANGEAAKAFAGYLVGDDPVRGPYVDNTAVGKVVMGAIR